MALTFLIFGEKRHETFKRKAGRRFTVFTRAFRQEIGSWEEGGNFNFLLNPGEFGLDLLCLVTTECERCGITVAREGGLVIK